MNGQHGKKDAGTGQTAKAAMLVLLVASSMFLASEVVRTHGKANAAPPLMSMTGSPTGAR